MLRVSATLVALCGVASIDVGAKVPAGITLDFGFPPTKVDLEKRVAGKKVILMGLPGAFTPT